MNRTNLNKRFLGQMDLKQFLRFCLVGISNIVGLGVYYFIIGMGGNYLIANMLAWGVSVTNAFFWNRKYVFKTNVSLGYGLWRSYASYGMAFLVGMISLYMLVERFEVSKIIAPVVVICITTPLNFILNKYWIFQRS